MPAPAVRGTAALLAVLGAAALAGCGGGTPAPPPAAAPTAAPPAAAPTPAPPAQRAVTLDEAAAVAMRQVRGIAQRELLLGDPKAPVEIIEYASLDCESCASLHDTVVPDLIARYVRTGKASIEFRALTSTQTSLDRALGAYAASSQQHGWQLIQLEYARQALDPGARPVGPPETPAAHAAALGLDRVRWRRDRGDAAWAAKLQAAESVWKVAQWPGAPVFLIRRADDLGPFVTLIQPTTLREFDDAIGKARRA